MTDVTHDRVCLTYALIQDNIDINVGVVIYSAMKKSRYHQGHIYEFGSLLNRFLRSHGVEEEKLDYRLVVDTRAVDVSRMKGQDGAHGLVLTMLEHQARNNDISTHMYGL